MPSLVQQINQVPVQIEGIGAGKIRKRTVFRCAPDDNKTTSSLAPYSVRSFGPLGQNHMVGWRFCLGNPDDKTPAWPHVHCGFIWTSRC